MISRYSFEPISEIWSDNYKYSLWTDIEITFLKHLKEIRIPKIFISAAHEEEIKKVEAETNHDIASFVQCLERWLVPLIGTESRFVHYGLTSSDIVDTAFSLQIKKTDEVINSLIDQLVITLDELIEKHKGVYILGRTHGQAAEKVLLNSKFLSYKNMLGHFRPNEKYYGKLSGSVGDYKYFNKGIADATLSELGLEEENMTDGQIIHRAIYAKYLNNWAIIASIIGKIATDIRLLSQSEISEIREGFTKTQIGSSSMPQKRNPIWSENLCGLARIVRGYQTTIMQDIELWNERDISHSSAERVAFPDASIILGFMLNRLNQILKNIDIDQSNIDGHIEVFSRVTSGQERMLHLINNGISRTEAHKIVKEELLAEPLFGKTVLTK